MKRIPWDSLKRARDGHLSAGRVHPDATRWTVAEVLQKKEGETDDSYRVRAFTVVGEVRYEAETWITKPALVPAKEGDTFRPFDPVYLLARAKKVSP